MTQRTLHILIGNSEPPHTLAIQMLLRQQYEGSATLSFTVREHLEALLLEAIQHQFDLMFIFLENVLAPVDPNQSRIEKIIEVLPALKASRVRGLIVLSACCPDPDFPDRVRRAGADHFLLLPFERAELEAAVTQCLGEGDAATSAR